MYDVGDIVRYVTHADHKSGPAVIVERLPGAVDDDPSYRICYLRSKGTDVWHGSWLCPTQFSKEERAQAELRVKEYSGSRENERLHKKYRVYRTVDGEESLSSMFVLDSRDPAAVSSVLEYADMTSSEKLRYDLINLAERLIKENRFRWEKTRFGETWMTSRWITLIQKLRRTL